MILREYTAADLAACTKIWNEIVEEGVAFAMDAPISESGMAAFLAAQSRVACAEEQGKVLGFYILHPVDIGRRAHIANASYAVSAAARGKGVGRKLVTDCIASAKELGFHGLQFNAVAKRNHAAIALYEKLGFRTVGEIPGGFHRKDGSYDDLVLFFLPLL